MAALLSNSLSEMCASISECQEWKTSSASAEYSPLSVVILGSCILQNSFDAWAAAAAETSAAIVATSWVLLTKGAMGLTLKVMLLGILLALQNSVEVCVGTCGNVGMCGTVGIVQGTDWADLPI